MSSPKRAGKPAPKSKPAAKPAAKTGRQGRQAAVKAATVKAAPAKVAAAAPNGTTSHDATRLAAEIEKALGERQARYADPAGAACADERVLQELRDPGRGRRGPAAIGAAHDCQSNRSDGDGERAVARRQSGRVRTRHVAELDRTLEQDRKIERTIRSETNHGPHCRPRPTRHRRRAQHHPPAGARPQAGGAAQVRRRADRRRRRASLRERAHVGDSPVHGERRAQADHHGRPLDLPAQHPAVAGRVHPGHGRPRHALSDARLGEDRAGPASRHPARRALDGRHERRLLLPVPDRHAQHRHASAEGNGSRAVLGLQPLAHREGAAGVQQPLLLDALHSVQRSRSVAAPCRDLRRPPGRRRLHGHDRAPPAGQR